ncbi:MAG: type VI secretion system baseplate subunit TssE [Bryobacteraceae bacterium]
MANPKFTKNIEQGLLDRLIDNEPQNRNEVALSRPESLRRFRLAVKRDLEYLLNTTRMPIEVPEFCEEAKRSVLFFGLPDIASISLQNASDEQRLMRALEASIKLFEPRLARARVTSTEPYASTRQAITFHVEAMLMIEPAPERISFDTVLEITKGEYSVKDS